MSVVVSDRPGSERIVIGSFDKEFERIHRRSRRLIEKTPSGKLYSNLTDDPGSSVGMLLLRSAGFVEQTCGGITTSLWDDPFEWTLPETLSTNDQVIEYLEEVEQTRKRAFACFAEDADLLKKIATPSGEMRPLMSVLLETLLRALEFQGRALALLNTFNRSLIVAED
jgi:hypothetical protein